MCIRDSCGPLAFSLKKIGAPARSQAPSRAEKQDSRARFLVSNSFSCGVSPVAAHASGHPEWPDPSIYPIFLTDVCYPDGKGKGASPAAGERSTIAHNEALSCNSATGRPGHGEVLGDNTPTGRSVAISRPDPLNAPARLEPGLSRAEVRSHPVYWNMSRLCFSRDRPPTRPR